MLTDMHQLSAIELHRIALDAQTELIRRGTIKQNIELLSQRPVEQISMTGSLDIPPSDRKVDLRPDFMWLDQSDKVSDRTSHNGNHSI